MADSSTKKRGCWTCYLRRKGCDKSRPKCLTCLRLSIACHGYGERPDWMLDGKKREMMKAEIRCIVKSITDEERSARARRSFRESRAVDDSTDLIPRPPTNFSNLPGTLAHILKPTAQSPPHSPSEDIIVPFQKEYLANIKHPRLTEVQVSVRKNSPNDQLPLQLQGANLSLDSLLDLYVDHVFPLMFPIYANYQSTAQRDWLKPFIAQSKPLYTAALALTEHWLGTIVFSIQEDDGLEIADFQQSYTSALVYLRISISTLCQKSEEQSLKEGIEALACIVHLIILEAIQDKTSNWQVHLRGAPGLHPYIKTYCDSAAAKDRLAPVSNWVQNRTSGPKASLTPSQHEALGFFSGVIIWFDILACVSTDSAPRYPDICTAALGPHSALQLQSFMGCANCIMLIIREIAILNDWKARAITGHHKDFGKVKHRSEQIRAKLMKETWDLQSEATYTLLMPSQRVFHIISLVFASAARVYLQVTFVGPDPEDPEIACAVCEVLKLIQDLSQSIPLGCLAWPFCIAGCMATSEHQQAFRELASQYRATYRAGGTLNEALHIMERCWKSKHEGSANINWYCAMKEMNCYPLLA